MYLPLVLGYLLLVYMQINVRSFLASKTYMMDVIFDIFSVCLATRFFQPNMLLLFETRFLHFLFCLDE